MWLPTPVYERIPQFWLLLGVLFMSSGTYLGFDYSLSFVYFGVGFGCCVWSLVILAKRKANRGAPEYTQVPAEPAQTDAAQQAEQPEQPEQPSDDDLNRGAEPVA